MSTIAQFVIELTANAAGVKAGLDRGVGYLNEFTKTADQTFRGLGKSGDAYTAAETIVRGIEQKFNDSKGRLRESLARGLITRESFEKQAGVLAQALNTTMLGALDAFRARSGGALGAATESLFVGALSDAGIRSGEAFASRFADKLDALGPVATKLGATLSAAVTAPIVAGGGLGIHEAIEGEADVARLNLAFGASVGEVQKALDALHDRFPAQRKGLEEMAASTALLLRSVDVVGPRAREMSLGLTQAAGALGLIRTRDPAEVLEKLQAGLRGNTRALGEFGISIKPASVQIEAQRLGLVHHGQAVDESRRALAAYSLIMQRVAKEVGNASQFDALASNQLRFLKRDAIEAAEAFGRTLLPAFTAVVRTLDSVAKTLAALPPGVLATIGVIAGLAASVGPLLLALGGAIKLFGLLRAALTVVAGAEGIGAFLAGLTSLSGFIAAGGGLLIGLGLVLAAVLAIRSAMHGADDDVKAFETSLASLAAPQLLDQRDTLAQQLTAAHARREQLLAQSRNPGAAGVAGASIIGDQLAAADEQISALEQKSALVGAALAKVGDTAAAVADTDLPTIPVDEFKEFLATTNGVIDSLKLVEERYALITRSVDSAVTLQGFVAAQLRDQAGIVAQLYAAQGTLADKIKSGTLSVTERAQALREELNITKAIVEATDRSRLERGALAFASQKLTTLGSTEAVRDSIARGVPPDNAALVRAFGEAQQAAATFAGLLATGVIPATSANIAALDQLNAAIHRSAEARDPLVLARNAVQFTTKAVDVALPGFDTSALSASVDRARAAADAYRTMIAADLIPATAANVDALAALDAEITRAADALDKIASVKSPGTGLTNAERSRAGGANAFQRTVSDAADNLNFQKGLTGATFANIGLGFRRELDNTEAALVAFARTFEPANIVFGSLRAAVGGVVAVFRSVFAAISPFGAIMDGIGRAAAPLAPVLEKIANVVAETLGPVFAALAPVLDALVPLIRAVFEVLSPILRALAPLFQALIPLLEALFPVFKFLAIVVTYLGQGVAIAAGVILKIVSAVAVTIGGLIAAIGSFISKIPFLGGIGRDIRDFGNKVKDFGHAAGQAGSEAFAAADEFARARGEIADIGIDRTADAVDKLGDAATTATSALLNLPPGYRVALARFLATDPTPSGPAAIRGGPSPTPPDARPSVPVTPPQIPNSAPPLLSAAPASGASAGTAPQYVFTGDIIIDGSRFDPATLFDTIVGEGKRRARATPQRDGSTPWYGVPG